MRLFRFLLVVVFLAIPSTLLAQMEDRDVLLTSDGTLYTIESVYSSEFSVSGESSKLLHLTIQNGQDVQSLIVPETLKDGIHSDPALAYDDASKTLFVFWQKTPNPRLSSDLLFASYHDGVWSPATLVDNAAWEFRTNLRIAVTRQVGEVGQDGEITTHPGLVIHVIWWNQTGYGEGAGYAQLQMENGAVKSKHVLDLNELLGDHRSGEPLELPGDYNRDIFRYPAIFELPSHDSVEMVFADWDQNRFEKLSVRPIVGEGVLLPPIGVWGGDFPPPGGFHRSVDSRMTVIRGVSGANLLFFYRSEGGIDYLLLNESSWAPVKSVALTDKVTQETAVEALRKLIAAQ